MANPKSKTRKYYKKRKTFRKRRQSGGVETGFVNKLRKQTRKVTPSNSDRHKRQTMDSRQVSRFTRSGRDYYVTRATGETSTRLPIIPSKNASKPNKQEVKPEYKPEWKNSGLMTLNDYGPGKQSFYTGPSIQYGVEPSIPHGKDGTIVYATGDVYSGDFMKGKREGTGKLQIKEGPKYEADWNDDTFVEFKEWKNTEKSKKQQK
jgi:hypothetical protein